MCRFIMRLRGDCAYNLRFRAVKASAGAQRQERIRQLYLWHDPFVVQS